MVEEVLSIGLPVGENMTIKKNRLQPSILTGNEKLISIVTGIHGDELEGQYICYELIKRVQENMQHLKGIIDVYPALNPLGIDSITRGIPRFDLDMNRIFPGIENGATAEYVASKIINELSKSDMCIDIHASNIFLREIPQVRINEISADVLTQYAKLLNIDFVWIHAASTVLESTLAYSLNNIGVKTLVVEMGVGMRITKDYGDQLLTGIFNLMKKIGIWDGPVDEVKKPIISTDGEVSFLNAGESGTFIPCIEHFSKVKKGQKIGEIINPLTGEVKQEVISECDGLVFTLREYPIVYEGSLLARVLGGIVDE